MPRQWRSWNSGDEATCGSLASVRMCDGAQLFINDRDLAMHLLAKIAVVVEPAAVRRPVELNDAQREEVEGKEVGHLPVVPPFPDWTSVESGFTENEGAFNVRKAKSSKMAQAERTRARDDRALHEKHEKYEKQETHRHGMLEGHEMHYIHAERRLGKLEMIKIHENHTKHAQHVKQDKHEKLERPEEPDKHDIQEHGKHETYRHGMLEMHEKHERHEKHEKLDKREKPEQVVGREREPARERERDRNRDQSRPAILEDLQCMLREINADLCHAHLAQRVTGQ